MITRIAALLILGLACVVGVASAQEAQPIKVGVAVMSANGTRVANGKLQRDRLVRLFKPDKKKQQVPSDIEIVAIPLEASSPEDLGSEAHDKGCDYVLYTTVTEVSTQADPVTPQAPQSIGASADPANSAPDTRRLGQVQFWHATVEFKLVPTGDPTPRLTGSSTMSVGGGDEISAVTATLNNIASRVRAELRSSKSVQP